MWKEANVTPLHTKGSKDDDNSYRPVSLLCCVAKILERIVFKRLYNYCLDHYTSSPHQSGLSQARWHIYVTFLHKHLIIMKMSR